MHTGEEDHVYTAWKDSTKTWTGLSMEESVRMAEDRQKWRTYVHGVDRGRLKNRTKQTVQSYRHTDPRLSPTLIPILTLTLTITLTHHVITGSKHAKGLRRQGLCEYLHRLWLMAEA